MTVVSSSNNITFAGDGVQNLFDFNFKIFKEEDLAAVIRDFSGGERELVAGSDFKLVSETGNDSGGRVMFPLSGSPLQTGDSITFYRKIAYSQELELVDNDPFSAGLLNEAFDRSVMRDQQLQEQITRALKYDISTPVEDQLSPQEFMLNVEASKDAANSAMSGAEAALTKSEAAQVAAESARTGAETAQAAAEAAKSEAEAIAWDGITNLRSATPVLSGPASANEGTIVEINITDYVEDSLTSYEVDVSGFGSALVVGSIIKWTLGAVDIDTFHSLKVVRRRRGEIYSETALHDILVKEVPIQDGATMAFANTVEAFPGATIDADGITPPAFSVGGVNEKQIVSGQMQVEVPSGEILIHFETSHLVFKTTYKIVAGDRIITDKGVFVVVNVTESNGVYSCPVSLPDIPTVAYKDPTRETLTVGSESTATRLEIFQSVIENESLFLNDVEGAAGTVISENSDSVPTDRLLALYDMKNVTDTVIPDVSGNGRDMTITKNEDKAVGTATVNGVPRNFVQNTNASAPTNQQGFCAKYALPTGITISEGLSWSYWLRTDRTYANVSSLPDAGTGYPCVDRFGGIIFNSYSVWLAIDAVKNAARDSIDLYSWTTSGGGKVLFKPVQGEWFNLTVAVKGTLANVYLNGEFLTSHTVPDLSIRTESLGVNLQLFSTFPGGDIFRAIASCAFFAAYNKELSPDEVSRIYKGTKYMVDITAFGFTEPPQHAARKLSPFALAAGTAEQVFAETDYNLTPADCTAELSDGKLILTADKIELDENPDLKQLAMAVRGLDEPIFKDAKIFIQEKL